MRIVYDDAKQKDFIVAVERFMSYLNVSSIVEYNYGMDRVQRYLLRRKLDSFLATYTKFTIGNKATHAHGIGNNCNYPVYFTTSEEIQHCANININAGLYSEVFVSIEDYNGKRVGAKYELTPHGITRSK